MKQKDQGRPWSFCLSGKMRLIKIEQVAQETFLFIRFLVALLVAVWVLVVWPGFVTLFRLTRFCLACCVLQHFIQLPFVEPYSPAFGAIINFNVVPFGHQQGFITVGTFHVILIYAVEQTSNITGTAFKPKDQVLLF